MINRRICVRDIFEITRHCRKSIFTKLRPFIVDLKLHQHPTIHSNLLDVDESSLDEPRNQKPKKTHESPNLGGPPFPFSSLFSSPVSSLRKHLLFFFSSACRSLVKNSWHTNITKMADISIAIVMHLLFQPMVLRSKVRRCRMPIGGCKLIYLLC